MRELSQRLDIAGYPSGEHTLPIRGVLGDAQFLDMVERSHPCGEQRVLGGLDYPSIGEHRQHIDDDDQRTSSEGGPGDEANIDGALVEATIDRLLDENGQHQPSEGTEKRKENRDTKTTSKLGATPQPTTQDRHSLRLIFVELLERAKHRH